jgi:hypothetical protein
LKNGGIYIAHMIQEKHGQLLRAGGASEDKENDATAVRREDVPDRV